MRQIVYISLAARRFSDRAIVDLWDQAARRNKASGIRGLLLFDGSRFMQAVEGEQSAVYELMTRIWADRRHSNITLMEDRSIATPHFTSTTLGLAETTSDDSGRGFLSRVLGELDSVDDPYVRAAFIGFARLSKHRSL